ncbi:hypothetical protein QYM41_06275 [Kocuria sp. CPCC 205268]|uniref:hypothetical protein n=1 Tax=Kocuria oxytropis TaxID=3058913 RepID=UPI0034D4346C
MALGGMLVSGTAAAASAAPPDSGDVAPCPSGFELMTLKEIQEIAAEGFKRKDFDAYDENGDNKLCVRIEGNNPKYEPVTFLFADNQKGIGNTKD